MGMVPVGSILGSLPAVCPTVAWLDRLLRQARDTIRPWGTLLFNAVEMDRGVEGHVIVHNDLEPISIVGSNPSIQSKNVPLHHHLGQTATQVLEIDRS